MSINAKSKKHLAAIIATFFGVGKISFAPGTWGSLAGVIIYLYFCYYAFFAIPILLFLGVVAADYYCKKNGKHDASEIVIDEVAGQLIAIFVAVYVAGFFGINPYLSERCEYCFLLAYAIVFAAFRAFDILKPFPICWLDKNIKGGLGVMLDDVVAGIFAGFASALIFIIL